MRPAGIYKSHDLMAYISWCIDFGQIIKVKIWSKVESQDVLMVTS